MCGRNTPRIFRIMRNQMTKISRAIEIELDAATQERLDDLARVCGADARQIAASLLHDILRDDAIAHAEAELSGIARLH